MTTLVYSVFALLLSALCFVVLMKSDKKRHRRSERYAPVNKNVKALAVCVSLSPCLWLTMLGSYSGLLVWLGGVTVAGWLLTMLPKKIV